MSLLVLFNRVLGFVSGLVSFYRDKRLTDAGEAKARTKQLESSLDAVSKANKARDSAISGFDKRGGLPDDGDPNLRN